MSLHEQIKEELREALKAKDEVKLRTVRNMLTTFTNECVATGKKAQDELDDERALGVIKRLAKQRKDSIEQYKSAGRTDLVDAEKAELVVLESYLPQMMGKNNIRPIAEAKKAELGIEDKSKIGVLMGAVMKELQGKADGSDVKEVVEELLG
jgi:uncharacterized protein